MARFTIFRRPTRPSSSRETIVFYPSYANWEEAERRWVLHIQGCIFNPRMNRISRGAVISAVRRYMRIKKNDSNEHFQVRFEPFLNAVLSGRDISIRIGDNPRDLAHSTTAGLFRGTVHLDERDLKHLEDAGEVSEGWIRFESIPEPGQELAHGRVRMIPELGLSIISDIDDTLKHSNVPDRQDLFRNTFLRPYEPIPGMPELYRELASAGAMFHYVSASPWQLYEPLSEFWEREGFPDGSFHLKLFRLRETARRLRGRPRRELYKRASINPILSVFPKRRFVLIGDSGEQDPQIYARLAEQNPEQIIGVYIRRVPENANGHDYYENLFRNLPPESWHVFDHPEEIRDRVLEFAETHTV